jgi:hypothetical protein
MNKYGARKTKVCGVWFDSKAEAMHYLVLKDRLRKEEITELSRQPKFDLVVEGLKIGTYAPDFLYLECDQWIAEDTKGVKTEAFALRAKLFQALHPHIELCINGVAAKRPKPISEAKAKAAA